MRKSRRAMRKKFCRSSSGRPGCDGRQQVDGREGAGGLGHRHLSKKSSLYNDDFTLEADLRSYLKIKISLGPDTSF